MTHAKTRLNLEQIPIQGPGISTAGRSLEPGLPGIGQHTAAPSKAAPPGLQNKSPKRCLERYTHIGEK